MEPRQPAATVDASAPRETRRAISDESAAALRGRRFGRFLLLSTLGRGGMGVVVEAHDEKLGRNVAIKLLRSHSARHRHARLLREAHALARLSHPNVVQIYDVGVVDGQTFIAMELVRGSTLAEWAREPRGWREVVELYLQAARGLAAAHAKDLVHRDFKPENCILGEDGRVRVVDFGLAREQHGPDDTSSTVESPGEGRSGAPADDASQSMAQRLTRPGAVMGTLDFMSLEQLQGKTADARTDQYSFCAALHEVLFGVLPYEVQSPVQLMAAMLEGRRSTPNDSNVPRQLRNAIERGLRLQPDERWPSMNALIAELEAATRSRRWWPAAAMLGLGVVLGGGLVLMRSQPDPCPAADASMRGAWSDDTRQSLARVFERHHPAESEAVLGRVTAAFDEYAQGWGAMAHESCEATFTAHQQSEELFERRTRCLERRRNRMEAAVEAMVTAQDVSALAQSTVLPFKLPGLDACADARSLEGPAASSHEHEAEPRYDEMLRRLDQATTLREIGRFDDALVLAEAVRDEVATLDVPVLQAEALEHVGRILTERGSLQRAKPVLEEAIVAASRAGADRAAARAWLSLMFATNTRGTVTAAEQLSLAATAAVERTDDDLLRAWLFNNRGVVASEDQRYEESRKYFEQSLEFKSKVLGADHVDVGIAWFNFGMMLYSSGRHKDARTALTRALSIFEATVGPSHFYGLYALSGICGAEVGLRNFEVAIERCERVIASFESSPVSPVWEGRTRYRLAEALWRLGRHDEAREMAQRAVRVIEPEDPAYAEMIERWLRDRGLDKVSSRHP